MTAASDSHSSDDRKLLVRALGILVAVFAAVTSLRNVVHFNGDGTAQALIVLAIYAALGAGAAMTADRLRTPDDRTGNHPPTIAGRRRCGPSEPHVGREAQAYHTRPLQVQSGPTSSPEQT